MKYDKLITNILDRHNVRYWTRGKNVSVDSINVQCPFYDCGDESNHMGIFKDSLIFHCWKCGRKGHFSYLLKILTGLPGEECENEILDEAKMSSAIFGRGSEIKQQAYVLLTE